MAVKNLLLSSLFAIGISLAYNGIAQVVVVAGVNSPIAPLTREQVAALFLGKSFVLPSGGIPVLVDQLETADTRKQFYSQVTEKSPAQVKAAWSRLTFSGRGSPPREVASTADVKKVVAANPNAIGYIEKSAVDGMVKVLFSTN